MPRKRAIRIDGLYSGHDEFTKFAKRRVGRTRTSVEFYHSDPDVDPYSRYRENPPTLYLIVGPVALYAGKKGVDLLADLLKEWLQDRVRKRRCKHRTVVIYGPNGEEVTVVECDQKARWKCDIKVRD